MRRRITIILTFIIITLAVAANEENFNCLFSLPEISWALNINMEGFQIGENILSADGKSRNILASNRETGVVMSVFIEPAIKSGGSKECRDYFFKKIKNSKKGIQGIKLSEKNGAAIVEYSIKKEKEAKYEQKNINIYFVKESYWIDVHLSKVNTKSNEKVEIKEIADNIYIKENYAHDKFDYLEYGSKYYVNKDYKNAAIYYEKLINLEKESPTLNKELWRIVVDNLTAAYGISGNIEKAQEIIEYGLSIDSKYPMLYYNLACVYAEKNNIDKSIVNLKKAFKYKENMNNGTAVPNPKNDKSFAKLIGNQKFDKFLDGALN